MGIQYSQLLDASQLTKCPLGGNKLYLMIFQMNYVELNLGYQIIHIVAKNIFSKIVDLLVQVSLLTQTDEEKQSVKTAFVKHLWRTDVSLLTQSFSDSSMVMNGYQIGLAHINKCLRML